MKTKLFILTAVLAAGVAQATTITGSGGTTGAQFVTSTGVFLTPTNATVQVGSFNTTTNIFTQFAPTDVTPITFGTSAALTGRWLASYGDNSGAAAAFNGQQIWFKIDVNLGNGITGTGLFGSTINFPTNGGGVGDGVSVPGSSLTSFDDDASTAGTAGFAAPGGLFTNGSVTIGVTGVPEPSTALLGLLGVAGLLRRRR